MNNCPGFKRPYLEFSRAGLNLYALEGHCLACLRCFVGLDSPAQFWSFKFPSTASMAEFPPGWSSVALGFATQESTLLSAFTPSRDYSEMKSAAPSDRNRNRNSFWSHFCLMGTIVLLPVNISYFGLFLCLFYPLYALISSKFTIKMTVKALIGMWLRLLVSLSPLSVCLHQGHGCFLSRYVGLWLARLQCCSYVCLSTSWIFMTIYFHSDASGDGPKCRVLFNHEHVTQKVNIWVTWLWEHSHAIAIMITIIMNSKVFWTELKDSSVCLSYYLSNSSQRRDVYS